MASGTTVMPPGTKAGESHEGIAMTEPGPSAPLSGPFPPPSAPPPPPSAPLPPPTGTPIGAAPSFPPPPPPSRPWLIPVIIGSVVVAVVLVAGVLFAAVQIANLARPSAVDSGDGDPGFTRPDPLLEGDPGSPVAEDPLPCGACFGLADARDIQLPETGYEALGLDVSDESTYEVTVGEEQTLNTKWWRSDGGTPEECYFGYAKAPLFFASGEQDDPAANTDMIYYPDWHSDEGEYYLVSEAVRIFDDSALATAFLAGVESAVAGCPSLSFPEAGYSAAVSAAPALNVPASVAAYGWVESGGDGRYYGFDLQRGNLVARLTLSSDGQGPSEQEFRDLVEEYAALLAELDPER